ncbi:MAG: hypothetical protein M3R67_05350 [Acidobacteriota bacterium]|nr:hypothetical protein [Acidobacteriota bacterium]
MKTIMLCAVVCLSTYCVAAQQPAGPMERRVPLTETAAALDGAGAPALEATLRTTSLNGADDSPVTNIRLVVKNSSSVPYAFVSGLVTFYDSSAVRCGEGLFKADALAVNEAFETDTPGIRIRCAPTTWRIVATNLLPLGPSVLTSNTVESAVTAASRSSSNLIISVDGEEHPIQIDKPMVLTLGNVQRTIVVREAP